MDGRWGGFWRSVPRLGRHGLPRWLRDRVACAATHESAARAHRQPGRSVWGVGGAGGSALSSALLPPYVVVLQGQTPDLSWDNKSD